MNSSDLPSYRSDSRKGRSTPVSGVKPPFDSLFNTLRGAPFNLALIYVVAKILQNGAKFIQKLTAGFKNQMRNLGNFRQAVESPES